MLEIKNLVKTYSTKGGVTVRALDDISVQFPATGMVFLLGRSGSGKSTLLNVSGGLDKPDSGEIIVKGEVFESIAYFLTLITNMNKIFLILGVVFGVFAGLMLVNFISVSISAKKKDIGILRAVGARGADVFKIFFSEAGIIAFICFILASVGSYIVCGVLNAEFSDIVNMELLNFGLINIVLILAISFVVSLMATFFPVYFASKKSPVDSIRAL